MATDFDTAVVSEAETQEADVEDFGAEEVEAAEDTTQEMPEDIQQDEAADDLEIQEDAVAEEADPVSDGEDEFSAGDDTEEAFSDASQLKGEYQYVYAGLTWGEYWAAEGVYNAGNTSSSNEPDLKGEADKGAFDTVTRATANHGLHRGSYQKLQLLQKMEQDLMFPTGKTVEKQSYLQMVLRLHGTEELLQKTEKIMK